MILNGELPQGFTCPYSGRPANDTIFLHVQCERSWVRGGEFEDTDESMDTIGAGVFSLVFFGWIAAPTALIAMAMSKPREELGREELGRNTSLDVPMRISTDIRPELMRMRRQRKLKALLRQTPIYSQLLEEFPSATITLTETAEWGQDGHC